MHPSRILAAVTIAVAAPLFASIELPRDNERWTRIDLDDYVIYSAARDNVTRDVAERLQLMRDGLAMMTRLNVHPPQRVIVIVFPNDRSFAPFRDAGMGKKMTHVSALFGGSADTAFILLDADSSGGLNRSVYHELTHCFTRNTAGDLPLWFSEGIAEFYSTFQTYGRDKLRVGTPIPEHLQWLQTRGMIPLTRLFAVDFNSPDYSEEYRAGDFYAESWLLVHYLMLGNAERNKQLGAFMTLLANKEPAAGAVEKAFGIKLAQLENELHRYLNQPTMNVVQYTSSEKHTYAIGDPVPATRDAILLALGEFLAHSAAMQEARSFYDAALKANPNNGDVFAALAELADHNGDTNERDTSIAKAVTLGTTDAKAYVAFGHSLLDHTDRPTRADLDKARATFEKAISLNPRSQYAYAGLGATYFESGEDEKAITAYIQSLALEPRDDVAFNLVALYARNGKRELAENAIEHYITPRGNTDLANQARATLLTADLNRAIDLAHDGKADDALAIVHAARDAAKNDTLRARAAEVEAQITRSKQIDEINRAIDMANKGHVKDALAVVDAVLPSIADADLQSKTKSLRAQLANAAVKKK